MKNFLRSGKLWKLYSEVVHQALFLEVLTLALPDKIEQVIVTVVGLLRDHKAIVTILLAVLFAVLDRLLVEAQEDDEAGRSLGSKTRAGKGKKRLPQARDENGRFI